MTAFPGITHVAVTVTDLARSTHWYSRLFGAEPVLDEDEQTGGFHHTVFALDSGQLFGLHTHPQPATDSFDEHRTGRDHVSFACRDRDELQAWAAKLDEPPRRPRWHRGRPLRLRCVVPRPRPDRPGVLRPASLNRTDCRYNTR